MNRTAVVSRRSRISWRRLCCWIATGVLTAIAVAVVFAAVGWLMSSGLNPATGSAVIFVVIPLALLAGLWPRTARLGPRALIIAIRYTGMIVTITVVFVLVLVGFGHAPRVSERGILALSIVAAATAALVAWPTRKWLDVNAEVWVYGPRRQPDNALQAFSGGLSRSIPMDELLLSLAESLKASMRLASAAIWTGADRDLTRTVSVPDQPSADMTIGEEAVNVAVRARAQGAAWASVWLPDVVEGRQDALIRVVSVAHLGELLGLFVLERTSDGEPFTEHEDRVLLAVARQLGLALHNVRLDSALQASLHELEIRNAELQASRERIVNASDESRRRLERDLHDGAQQHLVALAVKVSLIKQLSATDPAAAERLIDDLRGDIQAALSELRELAHGIYPPLLRERGLKEALDASASRSAIPVGVTVAQANRYPPMLEAAIYFCCLEALQNAAKHAGPASQVSIEVVESDGVVTFEVTDDGAGFDVADIAPGEGFVSMRDRLGVFGGTLVVTSSSGNGTRISGSIPIPDEAPSLA
jgi:signal transduction histidine kinase